MRAAVWQMSLKEPNWTPIDGDVDYEKTDEQTGTSDDLVRQILGAVAASNEGRRTNKGGRTDACIGCNSHATTSRLPTFVLAWHGKTLLLESFVVNVSSIILCFVFSNIYFIVCFYNVEAIGELEVNLIIGLVAFRSAPPTPLSNTAHGAPLDLRSLFFQCRYLSLLAGGFTSLLIK